MTVEQAIDRAREMHIDPSWAANQRFTAGGEWIPVATPGWGGVVWVTCTQCDRRFGVWLEHHTLFAPTRCGACVTHRARMP